MSDAALILYLHGFASSAKSTKAGYFAERLRAHDRALVAPDFNQPDFRTLTMTRMLAQVEETIAATGRGPATLIGSSLGGTLAVLSAARMPHLVNRLVLMAPAVMFAKPGHHLLPPERVVEWRTRGSLPFFHYAFNEERPLDVAFYEDTIKYDAFGANFSQPTVIFQGLHDASVPADLVQAFAAARPNVSLTLLDDDHQLIASLPQIWSETEAFLGLRS
jgi:pimeloyl-ACP methyl ester carboxylesterase